MTDARFSATYLRTPGGTRTVTLSKQPPSRAAILARYHRLGLHPTVVDALSYVTLSDVMSRRAVLNGQGSQTVYRLTSDSLWHALSGAELEIESLGTVRLHLDQRALSALSKGRVGRALAEANGSLLPIGLRLSVSQPAESRPAFDEVYVSPQDVTAFLASPYVPSAAGGLYRFDLNPERIADLLGFGTCTVVAAGHPTVIRLADALPQGFSMVVTRYLWTARDIENISLLPIAKLPIGKDLPDTEEVDAPFYPAIVTKGDVPVFIDPDDLTVTGALEGLGVMLPNPLADLPFSFDLAITYYEPIRQYLSELGREQGLKALTLARLLSQKAVVATAPTAAPEQSSPDILDLAELARLKLQNIGLNASPQNKPARALETPEAVLQADINAFLSSIRLLFSPTNQEAAAELVDLINTGTNIATLDSELVVQTRRYLAVRQLQKSHIEFHSLCRDIWQTLNRNKTTQLSDAELSVFAARIEAVTGKARLGLDQDFLPSDLSNDEVMEFLAVPEFLCQHLKKQAESSPWYQLRLSQVDDCALKSLALATARSFSDIRGLVSLSMTSLDAEALVDMRDLMDFLRSNWSDIAYHVLRLSSPRSRRQLVAQLFWTHCGISLPGIFEPQILGRVNDYIVVSPPIDIVPELQLLKVKAGSGIGGPTYVR